MARGDEFRAGDRVRVEHPEEAWEAYEGIVDEHGSRASAADVVILRGGQAGNRWLADKQYVTLLHRRETPAAITTRDGRIWLYGDEVVFDGSTDVWFVDDYDREDDTLLLGRQDGSSGSRSEWIAASRVTPHRRTVSGNTADGNEVRGDIVTSAFGRALLGDVDAVAQRTTLGLGTLATQSGTQTAAAHPFANIGLTPQAVAILNVLTADPVERTLNQQLALAVLMGDESAANALVDRLIEAREAGR